MKRSLLFLLLSWFAFACNTEHPKNIIFLLTDDQRWDALGAAGNDIIQTPNMDRLANEGVRFENAYVTTPICAVSRASLLSGQYSRRHGIHNFNTHFTHEAYEQTYPMQLKKAGYKVGFIGKYGVGRGEDFPEAQYDYWKCFPGQGQYWHKTDDGKDKHLTEIMGDQALEFLSMDFEGSPFCLSVSFKAPHVQDADPRQFLYDSAYIDLYQDIDIPYPATRAPEYWEAFPEFFKEDNEARRRWYIRFDTDEKYQTSVKGYYRLIYGVDVVIGRIRAKLDELDLSKNTVIILMGDNGFYLSEHGLAGKWYAHKQSIRVPLLYYDPSLPEQLRGRVPDEMALNIDVAPTILDVAGLHVPEAMQGKSLLPIINQEEVPWRDRFLFEHLFVHERIPQSEGIVMKDKKYVRFLVDAAGNEWLFDLEKDPEETINFADSTAYSDLKARLISETNQLIERYK